jgi:hypothetical protein
LPSCKGARRVEVAFGNAELQVVCDETNPDVSMLLRQKRLLQIEVKVKEKTRRGLLETKG